MPISELLRYLQTSSFRDLEGAHVSARVPVSRSLVNRLVAEALEKTTAPVRAVDVQPRAGDRFDVVVTVTWPFVPPLKATFVVDRQPRFPAVPSLVLRWSLLGPVGAIASRLMSAFDRLPYGVQLDAERLIIDIPALAVARGFGDVLPFVSGLEVHTQEGQVVFDVALEVR
jgi:hypothetical protein